MIFKDSQATSLYDYDDDGDDDYDYYNALLLGAIVLIGMKYEL